MVQNFFPSENSILTFHFYKLVYEKIKKNFHALAHKVFFVKEIKCFTLGGSLIPPKLKFEGLNTPNKQGDFVRQAVLMLGSPRVEAVKIAEF